MAPWSYAASRAFLDEGPMAGEKGPDANLPGFEEFTAGSFRNPKKAAEMFTEDGAPSRCHISRASAFQDGTKAVKPSRVSAASFAKSILIWTLKISMIETPEQAFAEYEFTAQSSKTGRIVHELFFGRLIAENGKIKLLRQSVNLVEVAFGVFPNGLADYKVPSEQRHNAQRDGAGSGSRRARSVSSGRGSASHVCPSSDTAQ
jgi:uncharacterized protein